MITNVFPLVQTIRRADLVIPNGRYNEKGTVCILNNIISMMETRGILSKEVARRISKKPLPEEESTLKSTLIRFIEVESSAGLS